MVAVVHTSRTGPFALPCGCRFGYIMENFVNKFKYAHLHNYDFIPIFWNFKDPDLPGAWAKVIAIQRYLPQYDWIWCTDVDAFVTNRYLSIEEHVLKYVPPDKAFVVARDYNHLNTGSFFIRNTPMAFRFLDAVYAQSRNTSLHQYDIWGQGRLRLRRSLGMQCSEDD
ncbi:hypothetical protein Vretifemale_7404 [Volvox reticuliferus]|nr:hypothetical protein Vretifemale_7404 [Volvox reticuliferus]